MSPVPAPCLSFDTQAEQAARLKVSVFPGSQIAADTVSQAAVCCPSRPRFPRHGRRAPRRGDRPTVRAGLVLTARDGATHPG